MKAAFAPKRLALLLLPVFLLGPSPHAASAKVLTAAEAADHIGEQATVCGMVASAKYAASARGQPTFLNFDRPYPHQALTVVIWGSNRSAFGTPEMTYASKRICVTGTIESYKGKPEIVARRPLQIRVQVHESESTGR